MADITFYVESIIIRLSQQYVKDNYVKYPIKIYLNFHSKRDGDATLASACVPIMSDSMRKTPDKYTIPPSNYMTVIDREKRKRWRGCEFAKAKGRSDSCFAPSYSLVCLRIFALSLFLIRNFVAWKAKMRVAPTEHHIFNLRLSHYF